MTKTVRATLLGLALLTLAGCATKNYGRQGEVTDVEAQLYTCRDIALEKARTRGFLARVESEARFDGRSVLSFLGDFGIGNVTERSYAIESGLSRLAQLEEVRQMRNCPSQIDEPAPTAALPTPGVSAHPVMSSPVLEQTVMAEPRQAASAPLSTTPTAVIVASAPAAAAAVAPANAAAPAKPATTTPTVTWVFGPNSHTTVRSTDAQSVRPSLQASTSANRTTAPASPPPAAVVVPTRPAPAPAPSGPPRATLQTAAVATPVVPAVAAPANSVVECGKGTLKVALLGGGWACEREEWVRGLPPPAPARKPRR